jgi:hypothetical protein
MWGQLSRYTRDQDGRGSILSSPQRPDRFWSPPGLLSNGHRGGGDKVDGARGWHHLLPKSRMVEQYLHSSIRFMVWCLINYAYGQLYIPNITKLKFTQFSKNANEHSNRDACTECLTPYILASGKGRQFLSGPRKGTEKSRSVEICRDYQLPFANFSETLVLVYQPQRFISQKTVIFVITNVTILNTRLIQKVRFPGAVYRNKTQLHGNIYCNRYSKCSAFFQHIRHRNW